MAGIGVGAEDDESGFVGIDHQRGFGPKVGFLRKLRL